MSFQGFHNLGFQKLLKILWWCQFTIYYKFNKRLLEALLEIKNIKKSEKTCSFHVHEQKNPKSYFFKMVFLTIHLEYLNMKNQAMIAFVVFPINVITCIPIIK